MRVYGFFIAAFLLLAPPVQAQTFKIATLAPDGSSWMNEMRAAAKEINERTEGRVEFKFYPGGVMGNDQSVLRKMRIGQLHGAAFTGGGIAEVYPDIQILGLPFLFRNEAEADYLREQMDATFNEGLEKAGFVNFGIAEGGFASIMSTTPIRSDGDLRNEKAWIPDNDQVAFRVLGELGVSPVRMPITDVLTGLQTGLISVIGSSPLGAIAFQWHTRVQYMTDEPLVYLIGVFAIDRKFFNKLGTTDQSITSEVMNKTFQKLNKQNRIDNEKAREALRSQGVEFVEATPETVSNWRVTAEKVSRQLAQEGRYSPELTNRAYELLEEYRAGQTN